MKRFSGRKSLTLSKETLRNLAPTSFEEANGGTHPTVIIVITLTLLLKGDTPT